MRIPRLMALGIGGVTLLLALGVGLGRTGSPALGLVIGAGGAMLLVSALRRVSRRQWRLGANAFLWLAALLGACAVVAVLAGQPLGVALLLLVDAALAGSAYVAAHHSGRRMERSLLITHYLRD